MTTFILASNNKKKLAEMREILGELGLDVISQSEAGLSIEVEETGTTFEENSMLKALGACDLVNKPCIADDSGLEVQALDGAPGVRSARYAGEKASDEDNNNLLLHNMKFQVKRTCRFRCALCVAQPDGKVLNEVDGICDGMLLHEPLGENGFGYDPLFWSTELHKGMAEASMQEKNKISHRGKAIRKLVAIWSKKK